MQDILAESLKRLKRTRVRRMRMVAMLLVLSLVVSMDVFWVLRQPGLTLAGDADCRITEHTHDENCQNVEIICELTEHIHTVGCYSDETADVETQLDWQAMFADYPYTGNLRNDLVGIAKTQVGYAESALNFALDGGGVRHGYTRYGAWYGVPYSNWSAMFVSFCLHYAGADPEEFPGNTGAASMAERWSILEKYADAGTYIPVSGDLVFFADNTVGIVSEVQSATIYVIFGDVDDAVCSNAIPMTDTSIVGWGVTEVFEIVPEEGAEAPAEEATEPTEEVTEPTEDATEPMEEITEPAEDATEPMEEITEPVEDATEPTEEVTEPNEDATEPTEVPEQQVKTWSYEELLDISNGPAFFIIEYGQKVQPSQQFMLYSTRNIKDLVEYLGTNGAYYFTLLDNNNHELPKDANGHYIVEPDTSYKLTISFNSPEGFEMGTYQYQIPNGLLVDGGNDVFKLTDGTLVGSWEVTNEGLITLVFNEEMNSRTNVTVSATMGIHFPEQEDSIDFDGKITVTVKEPEQEASGTKVQKWGSQGNPVATEKNDPTKIYWTMQIAGHEASSIPGSLVTDQPVLHEWSYPHRYTQSDIDAGLTFGASVVDPVTGEELYWHRWTVSADDPNLTWDENGWSYQMPETVTCLFCHNEIVLQNNGWTYFIEYTSTPDHVDIAGGLAYANKVEVDNQTTEGWARFTQNQVNASINKRGNYISDAGGAKFLWELQVTIPGKRADVLTDRGWYIHDTMTISNGENLENAIAQGTVTANYYGTTITVPHAYEATENDPYTWVVDWKDRAVDDGHALISVLFLHRCECTEETCRDWSDGRCCSRYDEWNGPNYFLTQNHCRCWLETEDTTFTFSYETPAVDIITKHGNMGRDIVNWVTLNNITQGWNKWTTVTEGGAIVPIPSVLRKTVDPEVDDIVHYNITINEAKQVLTDGSPLRIHDVMSDTLFFMSGSLVIQTEDANGNIGTLKKDVDYTVNFHGDGGDDDEGHEGEHGHVLDIVILYPQPVKYILDYDTTFYVTEFVPGGIKYTNSATVTLWGEDITDTTTEKVHANVTIAASAYKVELKKTAADTGNELAGANFGLYNQQGGLITDGSTDEGGNLIFQTNVYKGIILREHIPYYIQERGAPPGYRLDNTQYWLCFCSKTSDSCDVCDTILAGTNGVRISSNHVQKIHVTNQRMSYTLPATGGTGTYLLVLVSVVFVSTPLVYISILRRKRERRGVG